MKFKPYPSYKDSGIEWLGEVPEHWEHKRLKYAVKDCINGYWGDDPDGVNDIPVVRVADFNRNNFSVNFPIPTMRSVENKVLLKRLLKNGDLLLEKSGGGENQPVGVVVLFDSDIKAITANFVAKLSPHLNFNSKYLTYLFASLYSKRINFRHINQTTGIQNINSDSYLCEHIFHPQLDDQTVISNFLDRETLRIDALVEEKNHFIELLKEKRQALISHVVTKGLDPIVKMKDSGVDWLGEVPEHWVVQPVKYVIDKIESGTSVNATAESAKDNEIGVLKTSCVYSGQFNPFENKAVVEQEIDRVSCPLKIGMLIVSRMNTPDLVGAAGLVTSAPTNLYLPDRLWQISFLNANSTYVYYWTQSTMYRAFIKSVCSGTSSSMQNLSQDQFKSFIFPSPENEEQTKIANFLDNQTTKIDTLITETQQSIALLKEHRTALISAAVTGKIDVREVA